MPGGRRGTAAVLSLAVTSAWLVAGASGAAAVSATIAYSCTADGLGTFTLPVVLDTTAPARLDVGDSAQVSISASAVLPADTAKLAAAAPATAFEGSWLAKVTFGSSVADVTQTVARTLLDDQAVAKAVPFTASSAPFTYVAPTTPGPVEIAAGDLAASLQFYDGDTQSGSSAALTCTLPQGKAPVIDAIFVVAPSTTTLTLDRTSSEYGQDVTATATVVTSAGTADGDVAFSVDGLATKARVDTDGTATLLLPAAGPGAHTVTATFVPRDATTYDGSTTDPQTLTVTKARTRIRIPVTGRTTALSTRVGVRAKGVFGTVPTGTVRITVNRVNRHGKWVRVRTLDDNGAARAGFGRLSKGRYRAVVRYRGDAHHLLLKKTKGFRVKRA